MYFSCRFKDGAFGKALKSDLDNLIENRKKILQAEVERKIAESDREWLIKNGYLKPYMKAVPQNVLISLDEIYNSLRIEFMSKYSRSEISGFSDIISAYSDGQYNFGAAHRQNYWLKGGNRAKIQEAFAEFMEAAIANEKSYELLKTTLPTAHKVFEEMLEELLKGD